VELAYEILKNMKVMFQKHTATERYNTMTVILDCRLGKVDLVNPHAMKLMIYSDKHERFNAGISQTLATTNIIFTLL
jgi:hypothetical protein